MKKLPASQVKIPYNYVMIKPDKEFDTYQFNGRETGIDVAKGGDDAKHLSVKGTVYGVPMDLAYYGDDIFLLQASGRTNDESGAKQISELRAKSMMFDVPIEIEVGDIVLFNYQQYYDCYKNARVLETEEGEMLFVRYDELLCTYQPGNPQNFYMLNGMVLVEPMEIPFVEEDNVRFYVDNDKKVKVPLMGENLFLRSTKAGRRFQFGRIDRVGAFVKGYRDFPNMSDDRRELKRGDIVVFSPSFAVNLEYDHHRTLSKNKLYRFHRKDIMLVIEDSMTFDINTIISNFINN